MSPGPATMAERRRSNVLPFEPPGATAPAASPAVPLSRDAAHLLGICRDRLALGVATAFARNLGKANDDLLGMADRATSLEHQQLYFAAMDFLANRGQILLQRFRDAYVAQFGSSLAALHGGRRLEHAADLGELSLIDAEDFERDLAVGKLSARAACNCASQLTALERRLAALLHLPRVSQDENPLYPRALFSAMLTALGELGVTDHLALTLLQEFERQTSVELPGIYNDLNRELVDGGVLPKIPVGLVRPARRSDMEQPLLEGDPQAGLGSPRSVDLGLQPPAEWSYGDPAVEPSNSGGAGSVPPPGASAPPATAQDIFNLLARAIQSSGPMATTPGVPSGPPPEPVAGTSLSAALPSAGGAPAPAAAQVIGVNQLIRALTSLQRGPADVRDLPGLGSARIEPRSGQALQQLRTTPLASWAQPMDALTIDIVARLFDAIFQDPELSASLRAEIAKLQIPVLKVALMDKGFFSNDRDPARRLLDGIASAGIGRDAAEEIRIADKVRSIVDQVVEGFETDPKVFEDQVKALEDFLQEEDLRALSRASQAVVELEEQDRQALARIRVDAEIADRLRRRTVPALVADLLDQHWRLVLDQAYNQAGEQGEPWIQALATMDELLWSIQPKETAEDRARLLGTLPTLLKGLRAGLEALEFGDAWDPFFAQLIRLHVAALHNETPEATPAIAQPEARQPRVSQAPSPAIPKDFRTLAQVDAAAGIAFRPENSAAARILSAPSPKPPPGAAPDPHLQRAQALKVGTWVELESERGTRKTLRLSWVSELRGVYLFTNRQGENALTLAATSLADHLRKGTARILSQDRLTDRAVAQLLGETGRDPGALSPPTGTAQR